MGASIALDKSYAFALRIVKLYKYLCESKKEYTLSKQVLRSGTSIGANLEEARAGQSERDFLHKTSISFKECKETHYWLRLLRDSDYIESSIAASLIADCEELSKMLSSTIITMKKNLDKGRKY